MTDGCGFGVVWLWKIRLTQLLVELSWVWQITGNKICSINCYSFCKPIRPKRKSSWASGDYYEVHLFNSGLSQSSTD